MVRMVSYFHSQNAVSQTFWDNRMNGSYSYPHYSYPRFCNGSWVQSTYRGLYSATIAEASLAVCPIEEEFNEDNCSLFYYHEKCYFSFTDISKLKKDTERHGQIQSQAEHLIPPVEFEPTMGRESPAIPHKRLRSSVHNHPGRHIIVLPELCIIWNRREVSYIRNKVRIFINCFSITN